MGWGDHSHTSPALDSPDRYLTNRSSFLEKLIQETVSQNVQTALQQLNIPEQILQELTQLRALQQPEITDQNQEDKTSQESLLKMPAMQNQMIQLNGSHSPQFQSQDQPSQAHSQEAHLNQNHSHQTAYPPFNSHPSSIQFQPHMYHNQQNLQHY